MRILSNVEIRTTKATKKQNSRKIELKNVENALRVGYKSLGFSFLNKDYAKVKSFSDLLCYVLRPVKETKNITRKKREVER